MFAKICYFKQDVRFGSSSVHEHNWFDAVCKTARNSYLHPLCQFNLDKSQQNRIYLCESKKHYKGNIRKKKNASFTKKMNEIADCEKNERFLETL